MQHISPKKFKGFYSKLLSLALIETSGSRQQADSIVQFFIKNHFAFSWYLMRKAVL